MRVRYDVNGYNTLFKELHIQSEIKKKKTNKVWKSFRWVLKEMFWYVRNIWIKYFVVHRKITKCSKFILFRTAIS